LWGGHPAPKKREEVNPFGNLWEKDANNLEWKNKEIKPGFGKIKDKPFWPKLGKNTWEPLGGTPFGKVKKFF